MNTEWLYVRTVLEEQGPLTAERVAGVLTQFTLPEVRNMLSWAAGHDLVTQDGDRFELTERGRQ